LAFGEHIYLQLNVVTVGVRHNMKSVNSVHIIIKLGFINRDVQKCIHHCAHESLQVQ